MVLTGQKMIWTAQLPLHHQCRQLTPTEGCYMCCVSLYLYMHTCRCVAIQVWQLRFSYLAYYYLSTYQSIYYSNNITNFCCLFFSKVCQHNSSRPISNPAQNLCMLLPFQYIAQKVSCSVQNALPGDCYTKHSLYQTPSVPLEQSFIWKHSFFCSLVIQ